jgi:hypothetical protein
MLILKRRLEEPDVDDDDLPEPETRIDEKLPRCAAVEDPALVERAVETIRGILAKTVAQGMDEVGAYILSEFYCDDPALCRSKSHSKHVSLRALENRCEALDLPVRRTFLANALQMAVLARELPEGTRFLQLPPSHRVEIMRLRSPDKIEQFCVRAAEARLTVKKLRDLVSKECARTRSSRGRKRVPEVIKAIDLCVRQLRDEATGRLVFRREEIAKLTPEEVQLVRTKVETLSRRVEELVKLVG